MLEKSKALLNFLNQRGYKAYYIGGKPRNDIRNIGKVKGKLKVNNIDIITNAPVEDIKKIFPMATDAGLPVYALSIVFASQTFKLLFCDFKNEVTDDKFVSIKSIKVKPKLVHYSNLDQFRMNLDFTINALVQNLNSTVIDFSYMSNNILISALQDVRKEIIRAINGVETFKKDPSRILRMFKIQAMLMFQIDKETLKAALECKEQLVDLPLDIFIQHFNTILTSPGSALAIKNMRKFGLFKMKNKSFMNIINEIPLKDLNNLATYCQYKILHPEEKLDLVETYALLFSSMSIDKVKRTFKEFELLNEEEINQVIWLIEHKDLLDGTNLRQKIFKAKDNFIQQTGRLGLLKVIIKMDHIAKLLFGKSLNIYGSFCERPYFAEQLRVTDNDIISYVNEFISDDDLYKIKETILWKLINITDEWPYEYDKYMAYVKDAISEVLPNIEINIPPEEKMIDDYGNAMDHAKAIQHVRLPINPDGSLALPSEDSVNYDLVVKAAEDLKIELTHANEDTSENDYIVDIPDN